jgi:hypothetical protein
MAVSSRDLKAFLVATPFFASGWNDLARHSGFERANAKTAELAPAD